MLYKIISKEELKKKVQNGKELLVVPDVHVTEPDEYINSLVACINNYTPYNKWFIQPRWIKEDEAILIQTRQDIKKESYKIMTRYVYSYLESIGIKSIPYNL